jgi:SAM-dependent methyltransferase
VQAAPQRPSDRSVRIIDEAAARVRPDDPVLGEWLSTYLRHHRTRLATDLDLVLEHVPAGARLLEVGAIPPIASGALAALGFDLRAVDLRPERFSRAITGLGIEIARCDVETEPLPFTDASVDAALFNEIFEHLRIDPIFTLSEIFRVLVPGGLLLLSTPNLRSFRGIRNLVLRNQGHAVSGGVYRQYDKLRTLGHMGHVREYTTREVIDFLERIGFDIEGIIYRGGHGRGPVGLAERIVPSMRPFVTVIAGKRASAERDRS